MSGRKIIEGLKDAVAGNFERVTVGGQLWVKHAMPHFRCRSCDSGVYEEWCYCPFCGEKLRGGGTIANKGAAE